MTLVFERGTPFSHADTLVDSLGVGVDITGKTVAAQVRSGAFSETLTAAVTSATGGQFLLTETAAATALWPLGLIYCNVDFSEAGVVGDSYLLLITVVDSGDELLSTTLSSSSTPLATLEGVAAAQAAAALASATAADVSEAAAAASAVAAAASETAAGLSEAATAADAIATAADLVQTNLDTVATAADRVQTGLDVLATAGDVVTTGTDAGTATAQAGIATTQAGNAAASAAAALASETAAAASEVASAASAAASAASAVTAEASRFPVGSEILWPSSIAFPTDYMDTGMRLLTGASERAILAFGYNEEAIRYTIFTAASTIGAWFGANDAATLFTDVAGTTPVTTPGDAIALQLDKSGNGNSRSQATLAKRPLYALHPVGGVRNELVNTDTLATQNVTTTAAQRTLSFKGTGTVTLTGTSTAGPLVGTGVADIVSLTFTPTAGTLTLTVSGSVTEAQLELGAARTAYQTVGATFLDVSEVGKERRGRIWWNGTSHTMVTGTIIPGTDKAQVFWGGRKLSDASIGCVVESSTLAGGIAFFAPITAGTPRYFLKGLGATSGNVARQILTYTAPISNIVSGLFDLAQATFETQLVPRVNGLTPPATVDGGSLPIVGGFGSYPLYCGARGGTSFFFNGYEDNLIVRFGPNLSDAQITIIEAYLANLTPEATL